MKTKSLELLFRVAAVVLIGVAAFFYYFGNIDGVFVAAVIGCVAFFLSLRYESKTRVDIANEEYLERGSHQLTSADRNPRDNPDQPNGGPEMTNPGEESVISKKG